MGALQLELPPQGVLTALGESDPAIADMLAAARPLFCAERVATLPRPLGWMPL
jgi:hypothetical protein